MKQPCHYHQIFNTSPLLAIKLSIYSSSSIFQGPKGELAGSLVQPMPKDHLIFRADTDELGM